MKRKLLFLVGVVSVSLIGNAQYCTGGPSSTGDTNLQDAELIGESSTIDYSGCPGVTGLELQLDQVADLTAGETYTINCGWGTCGGNYSNSGNAWIDFNGNGTFEGGEIIAQRDYGPGGYYNIDYEFTVPADAVVGETRLRIMQHEGGVAPLNPCASFSWGSKVDFTIEILPACTDIEYTTTDLAFCEGETVTLTGIGPGVITWSDGAPDGVAFDPGPAGVYYYTPMSDDPDACPAEEPVEVHVIGAPIVNAGAGDGQFCEDEPVVLSASGDAHLYVWNDGDPMDLMPGVGTHTYSLTGYYTEGGCLGSSTDEVTITVNPLPEVTASSDIDETCIGGSFVFTGGGAETYEWDMGVMDGIPFTPGMVGVGTYTVTGTDINGCSSSASVDVEVVEGITITGTTVMETEGSDGEIDITVTGGIPPYDFDWNNDEIGEFGDDEDLTGLPAGEYKVTVVGSTGCEASAIFRFGSQLSVEKLAMDNLTMYPNPANNIVNIELAGNFNYELHAINGDVLLNGTGVDLEQLDLTDLSRGIYFVTISNTTGTVTMKLAKN